MSRKSPPQKPSAKGKSKTSGEEAAPKRADKHEPDHQHDHEHDHEHDHDPEHQHDHRDQAHKLLRASSLRVTAPRLAVLTALLDRHRPTTAQELISDAVLAGMDQVTVYRTLNTLVDEGIAQAVGTTDRGRRFEVHACEGCRVDHPHLSCRGCGALECLEQGMLPALLVPTEVAGFVIHEAKLYLFGLCPKCRRKK